MMMMRRRRRRRRITIVVVIVVLFPGHYHNYEHCLLVCLLHLCGLQHDLLSLFFVSSSSPLLHLRVPLLLLGCMPLAACGTRGDDTFCIYCSSSDLTHSSDRHAEILLLLFSLPTHGMMMVKICASCSWRFKLLWLLIRSLSTHVLLMI